MTDDRESTVSAAQLDRIAQLRARRGQSASEGPSAETVDPPAGTLHSSAETVSTKATHLGSPPKVERRRKRHVAKSSRIMAAGLGATTMFGIVGALGFNNPLAATNDAGDGSVTPPATVPAAPPIRVVVHHVPATRSVTSTEAPAAGPADDTPSATTPPAPIELTANPVVQTITVTAPPRASSPAPSRASAPAPAPAPAASATTSGSN